MFPRLLPISLSRSQPYLFFSSQLQAKQELAITVWIQNGSRGTQLLLVRLC